jgi:hypothetical protein
VHHSLAVRFIQPISDLDAVLKGVFEGKRSFPQTIGQRLPFDEFHHQEVRPFVLTDVMEGARVSYGLHIRGAIKGNASG